MWSNGLISIYIKAFSALVCSCLPSPFFQTFLLIPHLPACVSLPLSQDYKTYLDFVLALENRKEPAALQYIFKLLDMENQGYLNVFSLNYFFRVSAAHPSHKHTDDMHRIPLWCSATSQFFQVIPVPDYIRQDIACIVYHVCIVMRNTTILYTTATLTV